MNSMAAKPPGSPHSDAGLSGQFLALEAKIFGIILVSSSRPISLKTLPPTAAYDDYPLYMTLSEERGQTRYRLRLGAFTDGAVAESLVHALRLDFPSALVSELSDCEREHSLAVRPWSGNSKLKRKPPEETRVAGGLHDGNPKLPLQEAATRGPPKARELSEPTEHRHAKGAIAGTARDSNPTTHGAQLPPYAPGDEQACAFAVNLKWLPEPVTQESLPDTPVLHQQYLYFCKKFDGNKALYGIRAGFFPDRSTAESFAASLRNHFPAPELVPVCAEEFSASANTALPRGNKKSPPKAKSPRRGVDGRVLADARQPVEPAQPLTAKRSKPVSPAVKRKTDGLRKPDTPQAKAPTVTPAPAPKRAESAAASEEYRVISPLALLSYLLVAVALFFGWQLKDEQYIVAEFGLGYALGITGSVMMLLLLLYPLRKKARFMRNAIPVKYWYQAHIVLGILGPVLVIFHSNFSLGSTNSRVALFSTLLIAGSGIIGKYFYTKIHHGLSGRKTTLQELQHEAKAIRDDHSSIDLLPKLHERLLEIEERVLDPSDGLLQSMIRPFSLAFKTRWAEFRLTRIARHELRRHNVGSPADALKHEELQRSVHSHIVERLQKVRRVAEFSLYEQLFSWWHVLHFPLFLILIVAATVHVIAVHMY